MPPYQPQWRARTMLRQLPVLAILLYFANTVYYLSIWDKQGVDTAFHRRFENRRVFFAANLYNNEALVVHWSLELERTLVRLCDLGARPSDLFVSIYESGSTDRTPELLEELKGTLSELGVKHRVVTKGLDDTLGPWAWDDVRQEFHESFRHLVGRTAQYVLDTQMRIVKLAELRNRAIAPLLSAQAEPPYTDLVFLNDVVFTADNVLRLLAWRSRFDSTGDSAGDSVGGGGAGNGSGGQSGGGSGSGSSSNGGGSMADLACGLDFQVKPWRSDGQWVGFYDAWIAKDGGGQPFHLDFPFVAHNESAERLYRGLPITASCCWNGLAVLDPAPFQRGSLRFRAADASKREFADSEISLMCKDLRRLKGGEGLAVVVDPSVRVAYSLRDHKWANKVLVEKEGMPPVNAHPADDVATSRWWHAPSGGGGGGGGNKKMVFLGGPEQDGKKDLVSNGAGADAGAGGALFDGEFPVWEALKAGPPPRPPDWTSTEQRDRDREAEDLYYGVGTRAALDPGMGGPGWYQFRPTWDEAKARIPPAHALGLIPLPWPPLSAPSFAHECFVEWNVHCKAVPWRDYMYPHLTQGPWQARTSAGGDGTCVGFKRAEGCLAFGGHSQGGHSQAQGWASCDTPLEPSWAGYCECGGASGALPSRSGGRDGGGDSGGDGGRGGGRGGGHGGNAPRQQEERQGKRGLLSSSLSSPGGSGAGGGGGINAARAPVDCAIDGESRGGRQQLTCRKLCAHHALLAKLPWGDSRQPSTNGSCVRWRGAQGSHPGGPLLMDPHASDLIDGGVGSPEARAAAAAALATESARCDREVPSGEAGFCECAGGAVAGVSTKVHSPFTCAVLCRVLARKQQHQNHHHHHYQR